MDGGGSWLDELSDAGSAAGAAAPEAGSGEARRPCPECGEMIVAGAAKCRFCGAIFDPKLKQFESKGKTELRQMAQFHKALMVLTLLNILGFVCASAAGASGVPPGAPTPLGTIASLIVLVTIIPGTVFVVLLATRLYAVVWAVVLGVFAIIPCAGLIAWLVVCSAATSRLQLSGVKVGFFGASMSQF
jgi:hypothetical protein